MKTDVRMILRDIQAAARIGQAESLWAALDQLQDIPQIGGNHPLNESLLKQVILPVGKSVSRAGLTRAAMRPLITHPFAAYRAVAGVALVAYFMRGENHITNKDLNNLVEDPREDVRLAVQTALIQTPNPDPDKLEALYNTWQGSDAPPLQALAYQILPILPEEITLDKFKNLQANLNQHPSEVRKTLTSTLSNLGAHGHEQEVYEILDSWTAQDEPDFKLVAGSLSKPWSAQDPDRTIEILTRLAAQVGAKKRIREALQNLSLNGAEEQVNAALEKWRKAENQNLRAAGNDEKIDF